MSKIVILVFSIFLLYGVDAKNINGRIVGGLPARAGQFPFAAAISIAKPGGSYFCGGALLNSEFVLTGGQCVVDGNLFTVTLGITNLKENGANLVKVATEIYYLHPMFNGLTLENDIGAIKFREPIMFSAYITPITLLPAADLPDSSIVVTLGWGQISDATAGLSDDLNYAYLTTVSNAECRLYYGNQITENMVCVAGSFDEGTCLGDSGTPLVQHTAAGLYYLVGVSTFYSGNGCESPEPSGFTRTSPYRQWIRDITGI